MTSTMWTALADELEKISMRLEEIAVLGQDGGGLMSAAHQVADKAGHYRISARKAARTCA